MVQHLGKEHRHLFCRQAQLYLFTCTQAESFTLRSFLTALNQPSLIVRTTRLSSRTSQEHKPLGARGPLKIHHPVPPTLAPPGCQTSPWIYGGRIRGKDRDLHSSPLLGPTFKNMHVQELTDQTKSP